MSPITPSAASCTATMNSVEPRMSDWMWPSPSPLKKKKRKRAQMTAEISPTTIAAAVNTRSGS